MEDNFLRIVMKIEEPMKTINMTAIDALYMAISDYKGGYYNALPDEAFEKIINMFIQRNFNSN